MTNAMASMDAQCGQNESWQIHVLWGGQIEGFRGEHSNYRMLHRIMEQVLN